MNTVRGSDETNRLPVAVIVPVYCCVSEPRLLVAVTVKSSRISHPSSPWGGCGTGRTDGLLKPSFNDDNIHPNSLGLHELGVALAGALPTSPTSQLPPPVQLSTVARPAGTLVASGINCLAGADANADGLADGVTWVGAAPGSTTASLVSGAPGGGNWQRASINVTGWSTLFRINFDLTSVPDGGRCILAVRMRWNSTGHVGLNCYYPPLPNGSVKVIANDGKRHYPWTDGVASIELTKVAGQNSASFQWNCFPGTGTLDITQFTGYAL